MDKNIDRQVEELLSSMSLREKIGQLNMVCSPSIGANLDAIKEKIRKGEVGSLILATSSTAGNDPQ